MDKFKPHSLLVYIPFIITISWFFHFAQGSTVIPQVIAAFVVLALIVNSNIHLNYYEIPKPFLLYSLCIAVGCIRGFFNESFLFYIHSLLLQLVYLSFFLLGRKDVFKQIWIGFYKYGLYAIAVLGYFVYLGSHPVTFQASLAFVFLGILALPYLKKKHSILILLLSFLSVFSGIDRRSNFIKILVCLLIAILAVLLSLNVQRKTAKWISVAMFTLPIILFYLGVSGEYNIFKETEESYSYTASDDGRDYFVDSRSIIYEDVVSGLSQKNQTVFGLGLHGKLYSSLSETTRYYMLYREGRASQEVNVLNILQYFGLVGLLLYTYLYGYGVFLSLSRSRNKFSVSLGLFCAFWYLYSYVENYEMFAMSNVVAWMLLGLVYDKDIRQMSDKDIKSYFLKINISEVKSV